MQKAWHPDLYGAFARERAQPFFDLVDLVGTDGVETVVDLGCGDGSLTAELHRRCGARRTIGVDASPEMLARASEMPRGVELRHRTIESFLANGDETFDVIFSNAALHWIGDHHELIGAAKRRLADGGQLAFQIPSMDSRPPHLVATRLAATEPHAGALGCAPRVSPVLAPHEYARILADLGFRHQHVRGQVYRHDLDRASRVADWMAGAMLSWYRARMTDAAFACFEGQYRRELLVELGVRPDDRYTLLYERVLVWARL